MTAYIDLNPVRAGIVKDPKDYRWSSYGEAMAGKQRAREGIQRVVLGDEEDWSEERQVAEMLASWRAAVKRYRKMLDASLHQDSAREGSAGAPRSEAEALGGLVRQFTQGMVVGLKPFVDRTFRMARDCFGPKRRDGARKMRGIQTELRAMRDLQEGRDEFVLRSPC